MLEIKKEVKITDIKDKTEYIGEIVFNNIPLMNSIIKLIDNLTIKEPIIKFDADGLTTSVYDGTIFYEIKINKKFFSKYDISDVFEICVKRKLLTELFKKIPLKNSEVTFRVTKNIDLLRIIIKEKKLKKYDLRLLEFKSDKIQSIDSIDKYKDSKITIDVDEFIDMIESVHFAESKILLKCSEFNFDVKDFDNINGSSLIRFMRGEKLQIESKKGEIIEGYYNKRLLMQLLPSIKDITEKIIITYSTQSPIKIYFNYKNVELKYFLAPMEN